MTAIRALTGVEPRDLERNRKNKSVNWKESRIKVSSRLSNVIDKMIQENSEDRYQRVEEVLSDLSATEQTLIVARPTPNTQLTFINSIIQTRIPRTNIPLGLIFVCLVPFVAIGGFIVGFKVFYQPNILPALPTKTSDVHKFLKKILLHQQRKIPICKILQKLKPLQEHLQTFQVPKFLKKILLHQQQKIPVCKVPQRPKLLQNYLRKQEKTPIVKTSCLSVPSLSSK
jgi:hypothetical protein